MPRDVRSLSLAEQQDDFARSLLWREDALPETVANVGDRALAKRFTVYRNNVFASLTSCLRGRFPVVARLVGEEFFAAMARVFIEQCPPVSPALFEYGDEFSGFLASFPPAQDLPYLSDVARLEWHVARAYHAADAEPIDASALGMLGEGALGSGLRLHPSRAIVLSHYPIFSIWQTNTHDEVVRQLDAQAGEGALIVRPRFDVSVIRLDTAGYAFVAALAAGHSLELSADVATALDQSFDVAVALLMLFRCGAVVGVHTPVEKPLPFRPNTTHERTLLCAT